MANDPYDGVFDHLSPEDFTFDTSALDEMQPVSDFDAFVDRLHHALRFAFAAADGRINPMATIASATIERTFVPNDDETLGQFVDRVTREARVVRASRVFFCQRTVIATWQASGEEEYKQGVETRSDQPVEGIEALAAARGQRATEAVYWYAEEVGGDARVRHGFVVIEGLVLGKVIDGAPQPNELLGGILAQVAP